MRDLAWLDSEDRRRGAEQLARVKAFQESENQRRLSAARPTIRQPDERISRRAAQLPAMRPKLEAQIVAGPIRTPHPADLRALARLLALPELTVDVVKEYVAALADCPLGSLGISGEAFGILRLHTGLEEILGRMNRDEASPWSLYVDFEVLHPFLDGNGRAGRALWAWQMLRFRPDLVGTALAFVHPAAYAALEAHQA